MGVWGTIVSRLGWRRRVRSAVMRATKGLVPGRPTKKATRDYESSIWGAIGRQYGRSRTSLDTLRLIRDYNPDASQAVWNVLRLANSGHTVQAFKARGNEPDEAGTAMLNELAAQVGGEYGGGLDQLINVFVLTLMTQGAVAAEVELSENVKEIVDYHPIAPNNIAFHRDEDGHQYAAVAGIGDPEPLSPLQFRYLPLDPDVNDPYGRAPLWPALETVFFQVEVMRDLKAVVHNQGYPRIDVTVLYDIVIDNTPPHLKAPGQESALLDWVNGYLSDIQTSYNSLEPDDTFIHWDWVTTGYVGPGNKGSMDFGKLSQVIDKQIVTSLKQLPVLLGRNEGSTTTHATVQWQIYAAGIEALQRQVKRLIEWMHNLSLRVNGRQSYAVVTFNALRKADRYQEAQAAIMETENLLLQVNAGWITNDEAAMESVGHEAVGVNLVPARPRVVVDGARSGDLRQQGDAGDLRPSLIEGAHAGAPVQRLLGAPPEHEGEPEHRVPDWLWVMARATGAGWRRWEEGSFAAKQTAYLMEAELARSLEAGGNGRGDGEG